MWIWIIYLCKGRYKWIFLIQIEKSYIAYKLIQIFHLYLYWMCFWVILKTLMRNNTLQENQLWYKDTSSLSTYSVKYIRCHQGSRYRSPLLQITKKCFIWQENERLLFFLLPTLSKCEWMIEIFSCNLLFVFRFFFQNPFTFLIFIISLLVFIKPTNMLYHFLS